MKLSNDEMVKIVDALKKKKHDPYLNWNNNKLIRLWTSEIYETLKSLSTKPNEDSKATPKDCYNNKCEALELSINGKDCREDCPDRIRNTS